MLDNFASGKKKIKFLKFSAFYSKRVYFLLLLFCCTFTFAQFTIPDKPAEQTSVYDYIDLLSPSQKTDLEQKLIRYSDSTSTQIVITIIKSTQGENINYLGAQWGQKWGIGQKGKDNGILVILAKDDRRVAINTGYGTEGSMTDAMSRRIIETVIIPEFKKGDYYAGLNRGSDAIFKVLTGEFKEDRTFGNKDRGFPFRALFPILIFIVILIILANKNKRNGGNNGGRRTSGPSIWDMIILSNMGRSGHSGGSFGGGFGSGSGGGFGGGFGGGGFGGGGASGGW